MSEPFLERLPMHKDLLEAITDVFRRRNIRQASFTMIGAVENAVLGFYSHERKYENRSFTGSFEVVSCVGNVSEKDDEIFVHAHIVIAGPDCNAFGGHLMPGANIFAGELFGIPVAGPVQRRRHDEPTGLALWE